MAVIFDGVDIAGVLIDTRISETHKSNGTPTRYAIDGADPDINDQIVLDPREFTITGWISNIDGSGRAEGQRAAERHAAFHAMNRARNTVDVLTTHELYENVYPRTVSTTHEDLTTGAIEIAISFVQINQIGETNVPIPAAVVSDGNIESHGRSEAMAAPSEVDAGRKKAAVTEDSSTLYRILNNGEVRVDS